MGRHDGRLAASLMCTPLCKAPPAERPAERGRGWVYQQKTRKARINMKTRREVYAHRTRVFKVLSVVFAPRRAHSGF